MLTIPAFFPAFSSLRPTLCASKVAAGISFMTLSVPMEIYYATYGALVLLGALIGLFGSAIAMRRYLKV